MTFGTSLLKLAPIVCVTILVCIAILGGDVAAQRVNPRLCSYDSAKISLAAQRAIKDRLTHLLLPIFSYSNGDGTFASVDHCDWTVIGHLEAQTNDGVAVRLGWAVNFSGKPDNPDSAPAVSSTIVF